MKVERFSWPTDVKSRENEENHPFVLGFQGQSDLFQTPLRSMRCHQFDSFSGNRAIVKLQHVKFFQSRFLVDHLQHSKDHGFHPSPDLGAWFWAILVEVTEVIGDRP